MKTFRLGEFFCGPGGLGLGADLAKVTDAAGELFSIEHAWANDYDESTCQTYREMIVPTHKEDVICDDVRNLTKDENISRLKPINAFAFGFPCNDFSAVGEQKGLNGDFGPLYTNGVRILDHFNPDWFLAENVSGLQSVDNGSTFRQILRDLHRAGKGYRLTAHFYKFEDYGVPQTRHRVIIVGIRSDLNLEFKVPAPTTKGKPKSVQSALEDPPIPPDARNHELTRQSPQVVERLKYIKEGQNAWTADLPDHLKLNVKGAKLSQIYRRLHHEKPSYTITGSGGGGTHGYHWSEPRALTNRERARIQTFPDWFEFFGSKENVRRQIGMAVPPLGAKIIFEAILKTFAGVPYECIGANWEQYDPDDADITRFMDAKPPQVSPEQIQLDFLQE